MTITEEHVKNLNSLIHRYENLIPKNINRTEYVNISMLICEFTNHYKAYENK